MGSVSLNNLCNSLLSSTADGHRGGGNSDGSHGDSGLSFCLAFVQGFSSLDFIALKGDHAYVLKTVTFEEDIESYSWSSNENLLVIGFQSHFKVLKVTLKGKDLLIEEIFFRKTRSVCKDVKLIGKEKKIIAVGGIQGFELIPMDDPVNVKMIFKWLDWMGSFESLKIILQPSQKSLKALFLLTDSLAVAFIRKSTKSQLPLGMDL